MLCFINRRVFYVVIADAWPCSFAARMWSDRDPCFLAPLAPKCRPWCQEDCGDSFIWCCSALCPKVCRYAWLRGVDLMSFVAVTWWTWSIRSQVMNIPFIYCCRPSLLVISNHGDHKQAVTDQEMWGAWKGHQYALSLYNSYKFTYFYYMIITTAPL